MPLWPAFVVGSEDLPQVPVIPLYKNVQSIISCGHPLYSGTPELLAASNLNTRPINLCPFPPCTQLPLNLWSSLFFSQLLRS